jgi:hypothetical protein
MEWFPEAVRLLRDELPNIEVTLASQDSSELAADLDVQSRHLMDWI